MKMDCAISFYRREHLWGEVAEGLDLNRSYIERLIIVNDEPWEITPRGVKGVVALPNRWETPPMKYTLLDHPHDDPFGASRSVNEGIAAATTEYVLHIDDDIVLAPQALEKLVPLLAPQRLIFGRVENWKEGIDVEQYTEFGRACNVNIQGTDEPKNALDHLLHWCTGGFFIAHRESHLSLGGWSEDFIERGWQDIEYALRWILAYGPKSVIVGTGGAWHMAPREEEPPRPEYNTEATGAVYEHVLAKYPSLAMKGYDEATEGLR
jgi:glycosyltransferase involved in cell wall biosynthesis